MELALQFGWGMMDHTRALLKEWGPTTVILSPRDLSEDQLLRFSKDIKKRGARVLLDPQFYLPHSDHSRLVAHSYWPAGYDSVVFWTGPQLASLLTKLQSTNEALNTDLFVLPGLHATRVTSDWLMQQNAILEESQRVGIGAGNAYATVALGDTAVSSDTDIEELLEGSRTWEVRGIYLICEHPRGDYLVQDPNWLANQVDLIAGWRLRGHEVIVGYSNHQNLIVGACGATAIASGTWMNVRSFPPDKFRANYEEEIRRRTTWYYAPSSLSEYKIPYLDIAARQGLLKALEPAGKLANPFSKALFSVPQPSTASFTEQDAFRHYLHCLRVQCENVTKRSFGQTCDELTKTWDQAASLLSELNSVGVTGQLRDFSDSIDACKAALAVLRNTRGPILEREWRAITS